MSSLEWTFALGTRSARGSAEIRRDLSRTVVPATYKNDQNLRPIGDFGRRPRGLENDFGNRVAAAPISLLDGSLFGSRRRMRLRIVLKFNRGCESKSTRMGQARPSQGSMEAWGWRRPVCAEGPGHFTPTTPSSSRAGLPIRSHHPYFRRSPATLMPSIPLRGLCPFFREQDWERYRSSPRPRSSWSPEIVSQVSDQAADN